MNHLSIAKRVHRQLADVLAWYDERDAGLADQFLEDLERTLTLLRDHPQMYPTSHNRTRRARLRRFPYLIFYRQAGARIRVLSVIHDKRNLSGSRWQ